MTDLQALPNQERRTSRSSDPLTALSRLLDTTRRRAKLEAIALSDEAGCFVAGSGAWQTCEELAALAAAEAGSVDRSPATCVPVKGGQVRRLRVNGIPALLCSLGDVSEASRELEHALAGCERILGRRAPSLSST